MGLRKNHGPGVLKFDWRQHMTNEGVAQLYAAFLKLEDAKSKSLTEMDRLNQSGHYTPEGRAFAKRKYAEDHVVPAIKAALTALDDANRTMHNIRVKMVPAATDTRDVAGALRRQEIRSWFRSLPDARRNAMLAMPEKLNPEIAAAVTEQLPELSGVTDGQHSTLALRAVGTLYPEQTKLVDLIDQAHETFDYALQSTIADLQKSLGTPNLNLSEMTGITQSLADRLATIMAGAAEQTS
jgi:hypothetical protein